jgi:hypothetical protein
MSSTITTRPAGPWPAEWDRVGGAGSHTRCRRDTFRAVPSDRSGISRFQRASRRPPASRSRAEPVRDLVTWGDVRRSAPGRVPQAEPGPYLPGREYRLDKASPPPLARPPVWSRLCTMFDGPVATTAVSRRAWPIPMVRNPRVTNWERSHEPVDTRVTDPQLYGSAPAECGNRHIRTAGVARLGGWWQSSNSFASPPSFHHNITT